MMNMESSEPLQTSENVQSSPEDSDSDSGSSWITLGSDSDLDWDTSDSDEEFIEIEKWYPASADLASTCTRWRRIVQKINGYSLRSGNDSFIHIEETCCELCRIVHDFSCRLVKGERHGSFSVHWRYPGNIVVDSPDAGLTTRLFRLDDAPCPWQIFFPRSSTLPEPLRNIHNGDLLDKASNFISYCLSKHSCGNSVDIPLLPSRVIEIGQHPYQVRLTRNKALRARYICLSHCWGSKQPLKTTKENLSAHLNSLPWDTIPKCYQETIQLASKLGINYVWIDSLCIIQDDHEDWVQESQRMCDIYENAFLTVSATTSPDCTTGMWKFSNDLDRQFHGTTAAGNRYSLCAVAGRLPSDHPRLIDGKSEKKAWPLLDRAWAFQERMLSSRVLHFAHGELFWECQEETFCECGELKTIGKDKEYHEALRTSDTSGNDLASVWREVVQWYSTLSLTFESDKLPALSGLAQRFMRQRPGAKYLAGLWDDSLASDLMWINDDARFYRPIARDESHESNGWKPLSHWQAPSWSWAATNNSVVFSTGSYYISRDDVEREGRLVKSYIAIISAQCKLATLDATGQVQAGLLEVRGSVFHGSIELQPHQDDSVLTLTIEGSQVAFQMHSTPRQGRTLYLDNPDDFFLGGTSSRPRDGRVFCLRLGLVRRSHSFFGMMDEAEYAMVLVLDCEGKNEYRRIGMVVSDTEEVIGEEELSKFWEEHPSCFEKGGKEETITIV